jgi:prenyltransferase beta subunit
LLQTYKNYDGGFGLKKGQESHAGAVYLTLKILAKYNTTLTSNDSHKLLKWIVNKQEMGFSGRPHKCNKQNYKNY